MRAFSLFKKLTIYYVLWAIAFLGVIAAFPIVKDYLPVGGAQALLQGASTDPFDVVQHGREGASSLLGSFIVMMIASMATFVVSIPIAWTYIASRRRDEFDNSIVRTIIILPILLTSIVLMVSSSLALAFSLAGIVGAVRFRNTLKSPGDALYVLKAIGIGLACGIGAVEIALTMTIVVNYSYVILWATEFGVEKDAKRYLRAPSGNDDDYCPKDNDELPDDKPEDIEDDKATVI